MRIVVTGGAGFIGSHLMLDLYADGLDVIGLDNFNDYYDPALKHSRVNEFNLAVENVDMKDFDALDKFFNEYQPEVVVHLGARAGVRDSFGKEVLYHQDNIDATQNLIEVCKMYHVGKVIYASTSSVYGGTPMGPNGWEEKDLEGKQLNAYAYTKYVNEIQWGISGLNNVGLRFFTVYGPWGRPDMALFNFTYDIIHGNPIYAFNYGKMKRDFTYIADIIQGIKIAMLSDIESGEIFNIGRGKQVDLMDFIHIIGKEVGREPIINLAPRHPADTLETWSNTDKLEALGYKPTTNIEVGVQAFVDWYKHFYKVN